MLDGNAVDLDDLALIERFSQGIIHAPLDGADAAAGVRQPQQQELVAVLVSRTSLAGADKKIVDPLVFCPAVFTFSLHETPVCALISCELIGLSSILYHRIQARQIYDEGGIRAASRSPASRKRRADDREIHPAGHRRLDTDPPPRDHLRHPQHARRSLHL